MLLIVLYEIIMNWEFKQQRHQLFDIIIHSIFGYEPKSSQYFQESILVTNQVLNDTEIEEKLNFEFKM